VSLFSIILEYAFIDALYEQQNMQNLVLSIGVVIALVTGLLIPGMLTHFANAYSTATTNFSINKEIPAQVKSFILNQIVNKSKAAIVFGLCRSYWHSHIQLWKYVKST